MKQYAKSSKRSVLVIDDDDWVRDSMRLFFESEGCRVVALETAEDGLEIIKNQHFDMVITDYRLPGMDGIEFIRSLPEDAGIKLKIIITAYGSRAVIDQARLAGADDCILKPFSSDSLEASLTRLIDQAD